MEDLRKIKTMVSLAVYDKHFGEKDRKITSRYRRDYVYLRGLSMRLGVAAGFFTICGMYYLYKLIIEEVDIFELLTRGTFIKIGAALVAVLLIYSIICSFGYRKEYNEAERRLEIYEERLKRLNAGSELKGKKLSVKGKDNGRAISGKAEDHRGI